MNNAPAVKGKHPVAIWTGRDTSPTLTSGGQKTPSESPKERGMQAVHREWTDGNSTNAGTCARGNPEVLAPEVHDWLIQHAAAYGLLTGISVPMMIT